MKITAAFVTTAVLAVCAATVHATEPDTAPDVFNIQADHLTPEDCAFDIDNERWFQSSE
jgi:Mn2+/Fe2+ NRAMP family transporter